jgi:predicted small secreted protein
MKKTVLNLILVIAVSFTLTSCYTYTFSVGKGSQTGVEVTKKNHYLIYGLAALNTSNPKEMAGGAENYDVTITHSFIDGLINSLTFGIYNPTTTIVKK